LVTFCEATAPAPGARCAQRGLLDQHLDAGHRLVGLRGDVPHPDVLAGVEVLPDLAADVDHPVGLPWLSRRGSSFIWGVWHDAKYLADQISIQRGYAAYSG
jgi:hypothetical protein